MCDKFIWTAQCFDTINWRAIESYAKNIPSGKATNLRKLAMNWQNDNSQNNLFYGKSRICPACECENKSHMIKFSYESLNQLMY